MNQFKPVPVSSLSLRCSAPSVTPFRWAASLSLSLVLLACGGVADLDLGQDSSALEGNDNGTPSDNAPAGETAPSAGAAAPVPVGPALQPGTDPSAGAPLVPGQVYLVDPATGQLYPVDPATGQAYLVDPATGQLYLPCEVASPGLASEVPVALPVPTTDVDPATSAVTPIPETAWGIAVSTPAVPASVPCGPVGVPSAYPTAPGQPVPSTEVAYPTAPGQPVPSTEEAAYPTAGAPPSPSTEEDAYPVPASDDPVALPPATEPVAAED